MDAWDRQLREPARWFARFQLFLQLGPDRSIDRAYQACGRAGSGRPKKGDARAPGSWREAARQWEWVERAFEHDRHQQDEKRELAREDDRERRQLVNRAWKVQLQAALEIVARAKLNQIEPDEARRMLPAASRMLQNAVAGHVRLPGNPDSPLVIDTTPKIIVRFTEAGGRKPDEPSD